MLQEEQHIDTFMTYDGKARGVKVDLPSSFGGIIGVPPIARFISLSSQATYRQEQVS
jgi:hypothetical protein